MVYSISGHPNIYKLIEHIKAEQDHTEQLIARFNAGNQTAVSSRNKYIQVTIEGLLRCCLRFSEVLPTTLSCNTLIGVNDVLRIRPNSAVKAALQLFT